jgi:signal transduction histidine kinase
MARKFIIALAAGAVAALSSPAFAETSQPPGALQARAMLRNVVTEVKVNREQAFDMFNKDSGRFRDGDLYVFCFNAKDGKFVAEGNPNARDLLGQDIRTLKDSTGKAFGKQIFAAGRKPEGKVTEVSYLFARPNDPKPFAKTSFVTRVDKEYACGVGYYK